MQSIVGAYFHLFSNQFVPRSITQATVASFLSVLKNSDRFSTQNLISESLTIFRGFLQSQSHYLVLQQRPQDWLPRTIYSLVDSNAQVRQKALLVLQECLKKPREPRVGKTLVQIFKTPLDDGGTSSVMLIDMFCMAFDDLFKSPEDAATAAAIWGTVLRLVPTGLPDNNIESWEFFRQWIGIAQTVFEKGSPTAQICMLKAWREFIYITAEFPLALESTKLVPIDLIKPIVTLTRPLRLLLSPNAAVSEQADEVCMQLLYSCLNPAFATSLNTTELDVFWTDVVETCLRLYLKDGPHLPRRRKRALEILAVLFRPNPSSPPNLRSPPRNKIRWAVGRIIDDQLKLIEVPALSGLWVKSKSHIIIAALLNTVFPQIDLDTDPWVVVWQNFVTLTFQALYPTSALLRGQRLPDDTYNVLRTVMNGSVQILEEHATRTPNHSDQLLRLLVEAFNPLCPQLLLDNLLFSVSVNGPYIIKCASVTPGTLQSSEKPAPQIEDTLDLNPVLLLWTIVLKFAPTLRYKRGLSNSCENNLSLCAVSEWIMSRTQHGASDLVSVVASMMSTPEAPFTPAWSAYEGQSGVKSMNQNMESLNAYLQSPACSTSNRANSPLCKWLTYLTDCIRPLFTLSKRDSKELTIGGLEQSGMTPEQRAAVMPGEECLIFFILSFLEYNADCPELYHRTVESAWNELYNFIADGLFSDKNSPSQPTVAFTKAIEFLGDELGRMKTLDVLSDTDWATSTLVLNADSTTYVYRDQACTIVMSLLSRLEMWGVRQVVQGKTFTYEWCDRATAFIENCIGDGVVGIHLRMILKNFKKRHTEGAVLKSLKKLVALYSLDNEENRKLDAEARANVIKYKVPEPYLLPLVPTLASKVKSRYVEGFSVEDMDANCMLPRAPAPAPAPIVNAVAATQGPSEHVKEDHFEDPLEQASTVTSAPAEDTAETQVIASSFSASVSSPTKPVPIIDISLSPPQASSDSLDPGVFQKRVRGRPKRSGVELELKNSPISHPTEAGAVDPAEPEIVVAVTRTTRSVSAALSSNQESPFKQKPTASSSEPAVTPAPITLAKSEPAGRKPQNEKSAQLLNKADSTSATVPTQEPSGKVKKKVTQLRRTPRGKAAQCEEVIHCGSEEDDVVVVSLQPPVAPALSQPSSTATSKGSTASKKGSRSSRKRRRTRSETVGASASQQQDDTDMDEPAAAAAADNQPRHKKARTESAQTATASTTTTSIGIEHSAHELLQALEGYTSLTGSASEDGSVLDKTRVFELETKLMQALIQTRGLVMKMDDTSN